MIDKLILEDWNFASVPDDELPACLLWEYGREARTFTYLDDYHEANLLITPKRWNVKSQTWIANSRDERGYAEFQLEYLKEVGFDYEDFLQRYESFDLCYTQIYEGVKTHARPWGICWQNLPKQWREQMKKEAINPSVFGPVSLPWVIDLEALWKSNSEDLNKIRNDQTGKTDPTDDSEDFALHSETHPLIRPKDNSLGVEFVTALTIDFRRFTDSEIAAEFTNFLKTHRPADKPSPIRRGKKYSDARCSLERLGIMRALHHWQWRSPQFPSALKATGENACYKARKHAKMKFHELFPFLIEFEEPWSWITKADIDRRQKTKSCPI
jgi:hypothetical protein